jgi:hypothetical protein
LDRLRQLGQRVAAAGGLVAIVVAQG